MAVLVIPALLIVSGSPPALAQEPASSEIFWGWILGTVGLILSVPLTAAIKIVLEASAGTHWMAVMLGTEADAVAMEQEGST